MKVESIDVGKRIKSIRKRKGLTLQELSDKSGMSATAISAIERNVSSPTVSTLVNIARALGESLSSLLGEEEKEYIFTKLENREIIATEIKDVEFKSLGSGLPNQKFHPMISILKPGATSGADYVNHGGEDFLLRPQRGLGNRYGWENLSPRRWGQYIFQEHRPAQVEKCS